MKILIERQGIRAGLISAFHALGYNYAIYDRTTKPPFDAFDEFVPDLYLDTAAGLSDRAVLKCIGERRRLKTTCTDNIYPAADAILDKTSVSSPAFTCDVAFVGDRTPEFEKYLLRLSGKTEFKLRIYGAKWDLPEAVGTLTPEQAGSALRSAGIALNLTGPAVTDSLFQILISGTPCLSVPLGSKTILDPTHCRVIPTPGAIVGLVEHMMWRGYDGPRKKLKKWEESSEPFNKKMSESARAFALENTYFHRIAEMFEVIGMKSESERVMKYYETFRV
jgi:hypothetical protein